jgi:integrase
MSKGDGIYPVTLKNGRRAWDVFLRVDGKQYRKRFPTRKAAEAHKRATLSDADRGNFIAPSERTFGEYLADWVRSHPAYERYLRQHVVPALGKLPLQKLKTEDLDTHYRFLLDSETLGANSVRLVHGILKQALRDAGARGYLLRNPADHATVPAHVEYEAHPLSAVEVRRMLAATDESLFRVAVTTGMRRGELIGLRWKDVDLDGGTLAVRRATTKTRAGQRTVRLDAATVALLRARRGIGDAPVFALSDGRPWTPKHVYVRFAALKAAALLPEETRFHDLRHTYATHALRAGVPVHVVSKQLGHANVGITLNIYAHVMPGMGEDAAERVAAVFDV